MPDSPPPLGAGRYTLGRVLGAGGMAMVYNAHDSMLDVNRAIKVLNPELCDSEKLRNRFMAEARAMARLRHRNIVAVHDVGIENDRVPYIIMEMVRGGSAMDLLVRAGPQKPEIAGPVVLGVLAGLGAAHEQGIIHRDIKPHNILLTLDGVAKITDFGIAFMDDQRVSLTQTGAVIGTVAYMPPEQRQSAKGVGPTVDLFATGATLYALLTGEQPFDLYSTDLHEQLFKNIAPPLRRVIVKACSYAVGDRYASAEEMGKAVREALEEMEIELSTDGRVSIPNMESGNTIMLDDGPAVALPETPSGIESPSQATMSQWWTEGGDRATQAWATEKDTSGGSAKRWIGIAVGLVALAAGWMVFTTGEEAPAPTVVPAPAAPVETKADVAPAPEPAVEEPTPEPEVEAPEPADVAPADKPTSTAPKRSVAKPPAKTPETAAAPEKPTPAPAPVVASGATGTAVLNSDPYPGDISVDGRSLGPRGKKLQLPVGSHSVTLTTMDGRTKTRTIQVQEGATTKFCWHFEEGRDC